MLGVTAKSSGAAVRDRELGQLKVAMLKQEVHDLEVAEQSLTRLFDAEQKGISTAVIREVEDETHRKGIERGRLLYENLLHRLEEISSVKEFGGYKAEVITPPLHGELAVRKYLLVLGLGLVGGLLLGFASAYLAGGAVQHEDAAPKTTSACNGVPTTRPVEVAAVEASARGS
jgi:hypothetical protein